MNPRCHVRLLVAIGLIVGLLLVTTGTVIAAMSAGSIQGQEGWSGGTIAIAAAVDQSVDQSGVNQRTGRGAWRISNNTSLGNHNGAFGGWPFGPGLSVSAGQPSSGAGADQFRATLWFRSASASADGSNIEIDLGSVLGDDRNTFLAVTNRADADGGLQLRASEPDGATGNFLPTVVIASGIARTVWHRLDIVANFHDGPTNDTVEYALDGVPLANPAGGTTFGTFEGFREGIGSPYVLSNRLFFRSGAAPSAFGAAFVDTAAQGFYFDDLSYSVADQSAPAIPGTESPAPAGAGEIIYALTPGNVLIRFDSATPGAVTTIGTVAGLGANQTLRGIDFRPRTGRLYAVAVTTGAAANSHLFSYTINPLSAQATFVGQTAAPLPQAADVPTGYDFNPTVDRIRYGNTNDENARFNPNNGALAGDDTDLTEAATTTVIASAYDRNFDRQIITAPANNAIPTTLYVIDRNDSQLGIQGGINGTPSPNLGVVTDLGPLGFTLNAANDGGFDIAPGPGPQVAFAALTDAADNLTRLYTINLATAVTATPEAAYATGFEPVATAVGLIGNGLTEVRSIAIVPRGIQVVGADAGGGPHVRVFDAGTGVEKFSFFAYDPDFTGGVRVAAGDVTGDGVADIITGAGPGGGPHVRVFDGVTGAQVAPPIGSFFAFAPTFTGGVNVASGDVNADGFDDVIVGADAGGGPHVKVFSARDGTLLTEFFAFDPGFTGGVRVAAADFDLDGSADIVVVAGPGGGPHVRVFDEFGIPFVPTSAVMLSNSFFAYSAGFTGGVYVAAGDVNGDQIPDIVAGAGAGGGPHVIAFSGANGSPIASFFAYAPDFEGGVRVATADVNEDGRLEILTGAGPGGGPHVRFFDGVTLAELVNGIFAFNPAFTGGVQMGGHRQ
jgi:hypothetical protein